MKQLNPIDYQYWLRWWETTPATMNGTNGKNLRPAEYSYEEAVKEIAGILNFESTDKVLDVGCGTGEMMKFIAPLVKHVTGVDKFAYMLETAQKALVEAKVNSKCTILQEDAVDIKLPKESFDKVMSFAVIQYIHSQFLGKYIQDMLFVTKEGGKLLIGDVIPLDAEKYKDANVTMIPEEWWTDEWSEYKPKIIKSKYEDRYHVLLSK